MQLQQSLFVYVFYSCLRTLKYVSVRTYLSENRIRTLRIPERCFKCTLLQLLSDLGNNQSFQHYQRLTSGHSGDHAFPVMAARAWNVLPDHVTSALKERSQVK